LLKVYVFKHTLSFSFYFYHLHLGVGCFNIGGVVSTLIFSDGFHSRIK